jgi:uncharacterized protein (TIGR02217 family)
MSGLFIESPRFPDDLAVWSKSGISNSTQVALVKSGREQRNSLWVYPRARFDISNALRLADLNQNATGNYTTGYFIQLLRDWIVAMQGQLVGFRFKDWTDYRDEGRGAFVKPGVVPPAIVNGDGTTTVFQMVKSYTMGTQVIPRLISKPIVSPAIQIYVNGVLQTVTVNYTIDTTTGLVTFTSAPGGGQTITWTGQFDTPVRFAADILEYALDDGGLYDVQSIPLVEIRI